MSPKETVTMKEAEEMCKEVAETFKKGILNEIKVLHSIMYADAVLENEFEPIWMMTGDYLKTIMQHIDDMLEDIEAGRYLPKKAETSAA